MTPQITQVERIAPRAVKIDHQKDMSWGTFWAWMAGIVILVGLTVLVHLFIEPKPAQALTPTLYEKSDKEQEAEFCRQIGQGTQVLGASATQTQMHCMQH